MSEKTKSLSQNTMKVKQQENYWFHVGMAYKNIFHFTGAVDAI